MTDRTELPDEVKTFVVQALACWDTPSEVAKAVKDEFDLVVSRQAIQAYDPTKRAGAELSAEFRTLFEATRAAFLNSTAMIGISHRAVRLHRLQRLADRAEAMGNLALASDLLQQAAKEMGDVFTNRVALKHSGAVALDARPDFSGLSRDERGYLKQLLEKAEEVREATAGADEAQMPA